MKNKLYFVMSRAKFAAFGAAIGGGLGGLFSKNAASTGAALGALVGATFGEKRFEVSSFVTNVKDRKERIPIPSRS